MAELPQLTIEPGVNGIGYDDVLPVGDGGGGGVEQEEEADDDDDDDEEADDDDTEESVWSVSDADGERATGGVAGDVAAAADPPVGWIELSL